MRTITTAAAFAIAASLAAGQESTGKSGKGAKGADCTDCSADVLARSNILTNLFFSNWAVDGTINLDSVAEYCAADDATKAEFVRAVGNTVNFFEGQLLVDILLVSVILQLSVFDGTDFSKGLFLSETVDFLCFGESLGATGLGVCYGPDGGDPDPCSFDPRDDDGVPPAIPAALGLKDANKPAGMKSYLETFLNNNLN